MIIQTKNKKGESKMISVYWFVILLLVATGIVVMVHVFYGSPYDVRDIEANILAERISNCIAPGGNLSSEVYFEGTFRDDFKDFLLDKCNLTFDTAKEWDKTQYYVEINFYKGTLIRNPVFNITAGNPNWKPDCELDPKKHKTLASCIEKQFYVQDNAKKTYAIKILSMVRKTEQNVK